MAYNGTVEVISGLKQKNNGKFPLVHASAVQVDDDDTRLDELLEGMDSNIKQSIDDLIMVQNTQPTSEYNEVWIKSTGNEVQIPTYEEFENLKSIIASQYNATNTYVIGDYVIYNNELYKCITTITRGEAWNINHWTKDNIGNGIINKLNKNQGQDNYNKVMAVDSLGDVVPSDILNTKVDKAQGINKAGYFMAVDENGNVSATNSGVHTDINQNLTNEQKSIARNNINAASVSEITNLEQRINNQLLDCNAFNILSSGMHGNGERNGITTTWDSENKSCFMEGTASSFMARSFFDEKNSFPKGIVPGGKYHLKYSSTNIIFRIALYRNGLLSNDLINTKTSRDFVLPQDISGIIIQLAVLEGTVVNETVTPILMTEALTNLELTKKIDDSADETKKIIANELLNSNAFDILSLCTFDSGKMNEVTFTWNDEERNCYVTGHSTGVAYKYFFVEANDFPAGMKPGGTYRIKYNAINVLFQVLLWRNGEYSAVLVSTLNDKIFTLPEDISGIGLRLAVLNNYIVDETVAPILMTEVLSNVELMKKIDTYNTYNVYNILSDIIQKDKYQRNNVTFTWNNDICTVNCNDGLPSEDIAVNVLVPSSELPIDILPGEKYFFKVTSSNTYLTIRIIFKDSEDNNIKTIYLNQDIDLIIPEEATAWTIGIYAMANKVYNNDTITNIAIFNALSNRELQNKANRIYTYDDTVHGGFFNLGTSFQNKLYFRDTERISVDSNYSRILIPVRTGDKVFLNVWGGLNNAKPYAIIDYNGIIQSIYTESNNFTGTFNIDIDGWLAINILNSSYKSFKCEVTSAQNFLSTAAEFGNSLTNDQYTRLTKYDDNNVCRVLNRGPSWAGFLHHWGVIGASFDSGEFNYKIKVYPTQADADANTNSTDVMVEYEGYEYSCWEHFAKINGIPDLYLYANGGQNTRDWVRMDGASLARTLAYSGEEEQCTLLIGYYDSNNVYRYWRVPTGTGWDSTTGTDHCYIKGGNYAPGRIGIGKAGGSWPKMFEDYQSGIIKQVFVVNLGSNDINNNYPHNDNWEEDWTDKSTDKYYTCGTIDDIGTYDLSTNTDILPPGKTGGIVTGIVNSYAAYLGALLNRLIAIQPKCIIFLCTIRSGFDIHPNKYAVWEQYNDTIRQIAQMDQYKNNVIILDNARFGPSYSLQPLANMIVGYHPCAEGYHYIAQYWNTMIDHAIQSNLPRFKESMFIGTGMQYTL